MRTATTAARAKPRVRVFRAVEHRQKRHRRERAYLLNSRRFSRAPSAAPTRGQQRARTNERLQTTRANAVSRQKTERRKRSARPRASPLYAKRNGRSLRVARRFNCAASPARRPLARVPRTRRETERSVPASRRRSVPASAESHVMCAPPPPPPQVVCETRDPGAPKTRRTQPQREVVDRIVRRSALSRFVDNAH